MSRVIFNAKLTSDNDNLNIKVKGIKSNNKIVYKEDNIIVTILVYNNRIEMSRACSEYEIKLLFEKEKKTLSTYSLNTVSKMFKLNTYTKKLEVKDNEINIDYELEENNFSYSLKWGD